VLTRRPAPILNDKTSTNKNPGRSARVSSLAAKDAPPSNLVVTLRPVHQQRRRTVYGCAGQLASSRAMSSAEAHD
jgi:hypothetical protein